MSNNLWNYGGDIGNNPLDLVRYLIGDTTKSRHSPTDTEVEYWLTLNTTEENGQPVVNARAAAASIAKHLATRFRRLSATTQVKIGDMSLHTDYAKLADQYDDIVLDLTGGTASGEAAIGGPSWGDNAKGGAFAMGFMDNTQ
jgi:hypothetical protein